jgi:hypothetical protein
VTAQTLTQIILDEGRAAPSLLPSELLHELVRAGQQAVESGVEQMHQKVDRSCRRRSTARAGAAGARGDGPPAERLEELEGSLARLEGDGTSRDARAATTAARAKGEIR